MRPPVVVGACAIESVLVPRASAGTAADESRRERMGAVLRLDHLGENPKVAVGVGEIRYPMNRC